MTESSIGVVDGHGLIDTNIVVLRHWIDQAELPATMAIRAVTRPRIGDEPAG